MRQISNALEEKNIVGILSFQPKSRCLKMRLPTSYLGQCEIFFNLHRIKSSRTLLWKFIHRTLLIFLFKSSNTDVVFPTPNAFQDALLFDSLCRFFVIARASLKRFLFKNYLRFTAPIQLSHVRLKKKIR